MRVNERIYARTIRLIGVEGEQLGIFTRDLALNKANEFGLDLVEIVPQSDPPVCRIMDFTKYKYEQEKKEKEAKKHQRHSQLKEVRITPRIDSHDYEVKLKHIEEFLKKGFKVKIRMFFKGREFYHQDLGREVIKKLVADTQNIGRIDKEPKMFGRSLVVIFAPK